jgi:hypothetical protein
MKRRVGIPDEAVARALAQALAAWITDQNAVRRIVASVMSKAKPKPK